MPRSNYPTAEELSKIRHEYELCSLFQHNKIISVLGLEEHDHRLVLIREDFDGIPISSIKKTGAQDLPWFFDIAIQITDALKEVHRKNVIFKNLCPNNILYRAITGRIKLLDFSIASITEQETPYRAETFAPEGSLAYISPEQTGRLDQVLDYRSDFYSLGVTLYQLLTGHLPFISNNPVELIHDHIARMPTPPEEQDPAIPATVSKIILKLLEKTADKRYQSCDEIIPDLVKCLIEIRNQHTIVDFPTKKNIVSRTFSIPVRLYGRKEELGTIIRFCQDLAANTKQVLMISGPSGIGKTALVQEAFRLMEGSRRMVIKCKIDQNLKPSPYAPIVQGFQEAIQEILQGDDQTIAKWKKTLGTFLGNQTQTITDILPGLTHLLDPLPPARKQQPGETRNRFTAVFHQLLSSFSQLSSNVIFFLDDMHWIDQETLNMLEKITRETALSCSFIGTYRPEKTPESHIIMNSLETIKAAGVDVHTLALQPLSIDSISSLLSETLFLPVDKVEELSLICQQKSEGNPFFLRELLLELNHSGAITFDSKTGRWNVDIEEIRDRVVMHNVGKTLTRKINNLTEKSRDLIKLAACIGSIFNLSTLTALNRKSSQQTVNDLEELLKEGLILQRTSSDSTVNLKELFQFAHDQIKNAAYALIPENDKKYVHLQIGQLLQQTLEPTAGSQQLFTITQHYNLGIELLQSNQEKHELAKLNLKSAVKAKESAAYHSYLTYSETCLKLITEDIWDHHYSFALRAYNTAIDAASLNNQRQNVEKLFQIIIKKARKPLHKATAYRNKIKFYAEIDLHPEAIKIGLSFLEELGLKLPHNPGKTQVITAMVLTRLLLWRRTKKELVNLPPATDPIQILKMDILLLISISSYYIQPRLIPLIAITSIKLSLEHGITEKSAIAGYAGYGISLSLQSKNAIEKGYHWGQLAIELIQKHDTNQEYFILFLFNILFSHWKVHLNRATPELKKAYEISAQIGDTDTAAHCAYFYTYSLFCTGAHLEETAKEQEIIQQKLEQFNHPHILHRHLLLRQTVAGLLGLSAEPSIVDGEIYKKNEMLQNFQNNKNTPNLFIHNLIGMMTAFLFDRYHLAEEHGKFCSSLSTKNLATFSYPLFIFYYTLTLLQLYPDISTLKTKNLIGKIKSYIRKMKRWSTTGADNYEHKYCLMEALFLQTRGEKEKAAELYDKGIRAARRSGYIQEEALGLKLAASFYFRLQRPHLAYPYLTEALDCYRKWGAKAVVSYLKQQLQKNIKETNESGNQLFFLSNLPSSSHSFDENTPWLDTLSVIKTSRSFAGEVILDSLLKKLITILLENAGGQTAFLLLKTDRDWMVRARAHIDDDEGTLLNNAPIVYRHSMSQTIVNFVGRSLQTVVLNDACARGDFTNDPYIIEFKPKAILCMPIIHQGEAIGILYLENNLTPGAFHPDRLEILNLIASQAAVSIKNSILFEELEKTIKKLDAEVGKRKETQIQLMHAGKLSALGRLSASIAHEFGNPLIGLQYLLEDFGSRETLSVDDQNLIKVGLEECARMKKLINVLHDLHRPSAGKWQLLNINNLIENVLFFQQKNLKNTGISVKTDLDQNLPLIRAIEDQIIQTIVNLTINAVDALSENGGELVVRTRLENKWVILEIEDNGCGIPEDLQEHVFEPFFSTKETIDGIGLGLAITYSIVTNHEGEISFSSVPREGTTFQVRFPCADKKSEIEQLSD